MHRLVVVVAEWIFCNFVACKSVKLRFLCSLDESIIILEALKLLNVRSRSAIRSQTQMQTLENLELARLKTVIYVVVGHHFALMVQGIHKYTIARGNIFFVPSSSNINATLSLWELALVGPCLGFSNIILYSKKIKHTLKSRSVRYFHQMWQKSNNSHD